MIPLPNLVILILYATSFALIGCGSIFCSKKKKQVSPGKAKTVDSFEQHVPERREAKRTEEILRRKGVAEHRYDYKTFNKENFPESDFDKSI
ncbi:hypothetical protein L596_020163 [Steinernema carpocapsae]|uniref:Uncharacterized protein n=1 Tax=Steinernema carpocapsae TaxID=34508 RepID=A0A4U5MSX5_STECR|nr:hypothetical protein L596_020163 [Steinernema carpocapsae]